jgi:succinoglycan biosynthesis protein ExoA
MSNVPQSKYTVDIVIAARNESPLINACLQALAEQDYPLENVRIFVVDNGSTDDTAAIAAHHGATVIQVPVGSPAALRNVGITHGKGELIGFLDAHCIPERNWLSVMTAAFSSSVIGGCQSQLDYVCTDPLLEAFLARTGLFSATYFLKNSVYGVTNPFPWLTTANSMFRRTAVQEAGLFDPRLRYCEDMDLSWQVLFLGYQLVYADQTSVKHVNARSASHFFRQIAGYGAGVADLCYKYHIGFESPGLMGFNWQALRYWFHYQKGYLLEYCSIRLPANPKMKCLLTDSQFAKAVFRPWFCWVDNEQIRLSPNVIYWETQDESFEVIHLATYKRFTLNKTSFWIWRSLINQSSLTDVTASIAHNYGIPQNEVLTDICQLVEELRLEGIIESRLESVP